MLEPLVKGRLVELRKELSLPVQKELQELMYSLYPSLEYQLEREVLKIRALSVLVQEEGSLRGFQEQLVQKVQLEA